MAIPPNRPRRDSDFDIHTACARCGVELVAYQRDAGRKATCPECGNTITIPGAEISPGRDPGPPMRRRAAPPVPQAPARAPDRFRLRDEAPSEPRAPRPVERPVERPAPPRPRPAPEPPADSDDNRRVRAKIVGWLRRTVIVVIALVIIKVFDACFASLTVKAPANLHDAVTWVVEALAAVPASLGLLAEPRTVEVGSIASIERFMLGIAMLVFATRLIVRTKLLDAVYVTSDRWRERTAAGLGLNFMALLAQAGLLAWAASMTKSPAASDGLACGILALLLWLSAFWLMTLHLVASTELPEITSWMFIDAVFGVAIFLVVLWPGLTQLWTRAGATAVLFLANSIVALHFGASFVFAQGKRRWRWQKPASIVASVIILLFTAILLACAR